MSDAELRRLIFEPGFSTAATLTGLSGRGMGMDIVHRAVVGLRGTIGVESAAGEGTSFTLRLPLTLAIITGFGVDAGGESYVIPLENVVECVDRPAGLCHEADGTGLVAFHGDPLPYLSLQEHFRFGSSGDERKQVVVVRHGDRVAGIAVDSTWGECQAVIKPLGSLFHRTSGVSGSTILGSGRVALILDIPVLLREAVARKASTEH